MDAALPPQRLAADAPNRTHRPARVIWSAFAWTLIAALIGASIYGAVPFFRHNGSGDPTMTAFQPGAATPEATAESPVVNYGGDPGRSWNLGDAEPVSGGAPVLSSLGPPPVSIVNEPLVVGDTVIVTLFDLTFTGDSAFQTIRHNLATGERMWTSRVPMLGPFATDGEFIYGQIAFPEPTGETFSPGAIRLDSGEFQGSVAAQPQEQPSVVGPIAIDGIGYFANAYGDISVVDPGDVSYPLFAPHPTAFFGQHPESLGVEGGPPRTDMAMTEDWVFVVRPSKTIVKYDRRTGEELDSVNLIDSLRGDVGDVTLQAAGGRLVVTAHYGGIPLDATETPASIVVFDTHSLEPRVWGDIPDLRSNLVVTPDWIYVAGRFEPDDPVQIWRMHPVGGTFGEPVSEFAAPETASLGLSLSGTTLMAVEPTNAYAFIDVETGAVIDSGTVDLADDDSLFVFPMQLWGDFPVAMSTNGIVVTFGDDPQP